MPGRPERDQGGRGAQQQQPGLQRAGGGYTARSPRVAAAPSSVPQAAGRSQVWMRGTLGSAPSSSAGPVCWRDAPRLWAAAAVGALPSCGSPSPRVGFSGALPSAGATCSPSLSCSACSAPMPAEAAAGFAQARPCCILCVRSSASNSASASAATACSGSRAARQQANAVDCRDGCPSGTQLPCARHAPTWRRHHAHTHSFSPLLHHAYAPPPCSSHPPAWTAARRAAAAAPSPLPQPRAARAPAPTAHPGRPRWTAGRAAAPPGAAATGCRGRRSCGQADRGGARAGGGEQTGQSRQGGNAASRA